MQTEFSLDCGRISGVVYSWINAHEEVPGEKEEMNGGTVGDSVPVHARGTDLLGVGALTWIPLETDPETGIQEQVVY